MSNEIKISKTGEIHGRGSMRHRWVSRLTADERAHVRTGGTVLIRDNEAHHHTQCGWKQVTYSAGRYGHRESVHVDPEEGIVL